MPPGTDEQFIATWLRFIFISPIFYRILVLIIDTIQLCRTSLFVEDLFHKMLTCHGNANHLMHIIVVRSIQLEFGDH